MTTGCKATIERKFVDGNPWAATDVIQHYTKDDKHWTSKVKRIDTTTMATLRRCSSQPCTMTL